MLCIVVGTLSEGPIQSNQSAHPSSTTLALGMRHSCGRLKGLPEMQRKPVAGEDICRFDFRFHSV